MNINLILLSLTALVVLYISVVALKYALGIAITAITILSGSAAANHFGGQSAMMLVIIVSPVLYIVVSDTVAKLRTVKLPQLLVSIPRTEKQRIEPELVEVEAAPLKGEWISGKTPELTFKQTDIQTAFTRRC